MKPNILTKTIAALLLALPIARADDQKAEENGNGWLVQADDLSSLVLALRKAVSLPADTIQSMSENARRSVMAHSLSDGANRFVSASKDAIAGWAP